MGNDPTVSSERPARVNSTGSNLRSLVSLLGTLIVTLFPFVNWPILATAAAPLFDRPWFPAPLQSTVLKCGLAAVLAAAAFAICGRKPGFFGMRQITKEDIFAMFKVSATLFAAVIVLKNLQAYISAPGQPAGVLDAVPIPLFLGLVESAAAGFTEEFLYRSYLIEELGELAYSRMLAAVVSVVAFAFAHVNSGYGWSIDLIYPGLYGLALTILYLWRRNLWVCVFMHAGLDAIYTLLH